MSWRCFTYAVHGSAPPSPPPSPGNLANCFQERPDTDRASYEAFFSQMHPPGGHTDERSFYFAVADAAVEESLWSNLASTCYNGSGCRRFFFVGPPPPPLP